MSTKTEQRPLITVTEFEANRLTFASQKNGRYYVYDARGYQFVHYPKTGDILKEDKESARAHTDLGILFRAYDDSGSRYFAFFEADCFDPAMRLICADSAESAYDIYLTEFAQLVDQTESDYDTPEKCDALTEAGVISYAYGRGLVHSESVQGFELTLIKAEFVS